MREGNGIDFWRIVFTLMIMALHYWPKGTVGGWYIGVEFFFLTSGFLLMQRAERVKSGGAAAEVWPYIKDRLWRLYPHYLFSLTACLCFAAWAGHWSFQKIGSAVKTGFPEFLLLHMLGFYDPKAYHFLNGPAWYVAVLVPASALLYALALRLKRADFCLAASAASLLIYNLFYRHIGRLDTWGGGFLLGANGFFRGIGAMCLGMMGYFLYQKFMHICPSGGVNAGVRGRALRLAEYLGMGYVVRHAYIQGWSRDDFYMLLILSVCVAIAFWDRSAWLHHTYLRFFSELTFAVYLNHALMIRVFGFVWPMERLTWRMFLLFVCVTVVYSLATRAVVRRLVRITVKRAGFLQ